MGKKEMGLWEHINQKMAENIPTKIAVFWDAKLRIKESEVRAGRVFIAVQLQGAQLSHCRSRHIRKRVAYVRTPLLEIKPMFS